MESVNRFHYPNYMHHFSLQIPVFQCGGTIIPQRLRKRRASTLAIHDPITLIIALDRNVRNTTLQILDLILVLLFSKKLKVISISMMVKRMTIVKNINIFIVNLH